MTFKEYIVLIIICLFIILAFDRKEPTAREEYDSWRAEEKYINR